MVEVHKIGLHLYKGVDKNSGLFEYNLIKDYVSTFFKINQLDKNKKMLIIVNGLFSSVDEENELLVKMQQYDIKVFIASDIVAITNNKSIIEKCNFLLHQCPKRNIPNVPNNVKQRYSYVPELFYFNGHNEKEYNKTLFFGGGVRDMENKLDEIQNVTDCDFLLKNNNSDNRLPYSEYIKLQSKYKYTLIICRKDYSDIGWITARFIECICNNNYPIVLDCYDVDNYFGLCKISNIKDIPSVIDYVNSNETFRLEFISHYKNRFERDRFKLLELLEEIYNE